MRALCLWWLGFAAIAAGSTAQSAPRSTDIYLASLSSENGRPSVGRAVNVTKRPGYDNQPSFTPDGRAVLYTARLADDQADIYRFDLRTRRISQVTHTPESEYSATVMPGGRRFSVIRVESDSTQRLWSFDMRGRTPALVLENVKPVGYQAWIDDHTVALFVLGTPNSLVLADTKTGSTRVVAHDIGRSLQTIPRTRALSFLQRADSAWWVETIDARSPLDSAVRLVRMLAGSDYLVWMRDGTAIAGQGAKLFAWNSAWHDDWREIADLSGSGLDHISRLAISPDGRRLAIVAEPTDERAR